jgi:hypothetical protein
MLVKKFYCVQVLTLSICILQSFSINASFDQQWHCMQEEYSRVFQSLCNQNLDILEQHYIHPYWQGARERIRNTILGEPEKNFLGDKQLGYDMVRRIMGVAQTYEICYLEHCITPKTQKLIQQFKESECAQLDIDCYQYNCSSNTLGHLFYAAKILENKKDLPIKTIVEFGSGYGNLAHIFKTMLPDTTLYLIDLPELLAIQLLFLRESMPEIPVYFHAQIPSSYQENAIHLIPIHIIEQCSIYADLFISTFALSEATELVQKMMIKNNFFNAKMVYITGQIDGWGKLNFVPHALLINAVKNYCQHSICQPTHLIFNERVSYEILGTKN